MNSIDGFQLYDFFYAGFRRVSDARSYIDKINVFPVPDGDTGTNLYFTLSGALEATKPELSATATLADLADAALLSARGNSGVIFAQFVSGLSEAIVTSEVLAQQFAQAVENAYQRAKTAVSQPRDGTMLTVIETWALSLKYRLSDTSNIAALIGATREDLKRSLSETTDKLAELKAAGVVDAGAAGFVEFVEGGHDYLVFGKGAAEILPDDLKAIIDHGHADAPVKKPLLRYCVEAIVSADKIETEAVRHALSPVGDSLIVAGGRRRVKIHIHADDPIQVMEQLEQFGAVNGQKVDDMYIQYADAHHPESRLAIVTDSSCDLAPELIEQYRIHMVPLLILAQKGEYLDKLTIDAERLRDLSENAAVFPRSSQPPAHPFARTFSYLSEYYDEILSINLSSAMSGTFAACAKEAERSNGKAVAFNSRHLSGSLGLLVLRAAQAAKAGLRRDEILAKLPEWVGKARILVSVSSLRYMVKGGRVSPLKGFLARILNLKPIVSVDEEGKSILYGKAFSEKANIEKIKRMVMEDHARRPLRCYAIGHSGAPDKAAALAAEMEKALGFPPLYVSEISAVVALNAGPGAVSVVTMAE
jgi:hypothetical protein